RRSSCVGEGKVGTSSQYEKPSSGKVNPREEKITTLGASSHEGTEPRMTCSWLQLGIPIVETRLPRPCGSVAKSWGVSFASQDVAVPSRSSPSRMFLSSTPEPCGPETGSVSQAKVMSSTGTS